MLLYNGIITLDYNPSTDILLTSMPDVKQFTFSEVSFCLGLIVDHIRHYDIKYLLLDASKSVIEHEEETYQALATQFVHDLKNTRLQKIARVGTRDTKREELSAKVSRELNLPMKVENFHSPTEALDWLLASRQA